MNEHSNHIWLASYPRSGNTLVRTILFKCFNLKSGSIYPRDLGHNKSLEEYSGHIEQNQNGEIDFKDQKLKIIKTHNLHNDNFKTIYVIRDARPVVLSMYKFYKKNISINDIILGNHRFGTWFNHINHWKPYERSNTLLLKYEDLLSSFKNELNKISNFIDKEIIDYNFPNRNEISKIDGKWVNSYTNWKNELEKKEIDLCNSINQEFLIKYDYI